MKEIENFQQTNNEPVNESPNSHGVRMFGMDRGLKKALLHAFGMDLCCKKLTNMRLGWTTDY